MTHFGDRLRRFRQDCRLCNRCSSPARNLRVVKNTLNAYKVHRTTSIGFQELVGRFVLAPLRGFTLVGHPALVPSSYVDASALLLIVLRFNSVLLAYEFPIWNQGRRCKAAESHFPGICSGNRVELLRLTNVGTARS